MKWVASLLVASFFASQLFAGMTVTSTVKTEGAGREGENSASTRVKVDDEKARIEWIEGRNPAVPPKGYMLTRDGGLTLYMVNPEEKSYMKWDTAAMARMAAGMSGLLNMKVKEYKVEKTLEENGPEILGYPTKHYKFVTTYSMEMSVFGMKKASSGKTEQEIWSTTKIKVPAMTAFEKMASQSMAGMGDLQKAVDAEKAKSVKGFPLKTVTTTDSGTPQNPQIVKNIMEVTEIKEGRIPAADFELPKDYKEVNMAGETDAETGAAASEDKETEKSAKPAKPATPAKTPSGFDGFMKNLGDKFNRL